MERSQDSRDRLPRRNW